MADDQTSSKLNLRGNNVDTERGEKFWNTSEVEMKFSVEREWIRAIRKARCRPNYGMGSMNSGLEEIAGNKLELSGPLIDLYLKEIGEQIGSKLSRSKSTGLASPVILFVPWQIFRHVTTLFRGYGASEVRFDRKKSQIISIINSMETMDKVFSPSRFDGRDFLRKRHFGRVPDKNGKLVSEYKGRSAIVVTESTPCTFNFNLRKQKVTVTFFIQRYSSSDFAVDTTLQALMNQ